MSARRRDVWIANNVFVEASHGSLNPGKRADYKVWTLELRIKWWSRRGHGDGRRLRERSAMTDGATWAAADTTPTGLDGPPNGRSTSASPPFTVPESNGADIEKFLIRQGGANPSDYAAVLRLVAARRRRRRRVARASSARASTP